MVFTGGHRQDGNIFLTCVLAYYTFTQKSIIKLGLWILRYNKVQPPDFNDERNGRLIKGTQGYWAFVPNNLPPKLTITIDLVNQLSEADRALSELAGVARTLPNPHLLIDPFVRREAVLSSRIEGTQASLSDLFFFEAGSWKEKEVPDVREVHHYVKALEYGLARLKELLTFRPQEIHAIISQRIQRPHAGPWRIQTLAKLDRSSRMHFDGGHIRTAAAQRINVSA